MHRSHINLDIPSVVLNASVDLCATDQERFSKFGTGPMIEPQHTLIHLAITAASKKDPQAVAVEFGGQVLSYGELDQRSNALAYALASKGVSSGDAIGLFLRRSIDMVIAIVAILKMGACYVPQDIALVPQEQLKHVVDNAAINCILTTEEYRERLTRTFPAKVHGIASLIETYSGKVPGNYACWQGTEQQRAFILYTSGTTGKPNGVQVTHRNLCNIILTEPGRLGMRPGIRVAQILNICFDMAAWEILGSLCHGATLVIRGDNIEDTVRRCNVIIATPSVLGTIDPQQCQNVEAVAVAGEPCPEKLAIRWAQYAKFHNCCGPTETTIVNTMSLYQKGGLLTIGRPTPNNTVYVLRSDGSPCAIGDVGEMWAGGDCVTAGYLNNTILNAERYRPDPFLGQGRLMFRTRDLGKWTPDGELVHMGRVDDQVKVRGFRVELDGVSSVLERSERCTRAVTLKLDDRNLVAFVQPASVDATAARVMVERELPYYCVPKLVFSLSDLPLTSRGKIDKSELLAFAREQLASSKHERVQAC